MNRKCTMLSERSHTQKATHCMIPFVWHSRKGNATETERKLVDTRDWEWEEGQDEEEISWGDGTILYHEYGSGYTMVHCQNSQKYTAKSEFYWM